jgi:NADH:ubiquinone oxidoreductase subunit F (NADH-binding)/NADH:ubiquinone oxidoreductase subunit E
MSQVAPDSSGSRKTGSTGTNAAPAGGAAPAPESGGGTPTGMSGIGGFSRPAPKPASKSKVGTVTTGQAKLVEELRKTQEKAGGWLPGDEVQALARTINLPIYEVYGVATFFPTTYRVTPPPKASIKVCLDVSCHLKGAYDVMQKIKGMAGDDPAVEIEGCSCLGQCDRAPAITVNDHVVVGPLENNVLDAARQAIRGVEQDLHGPPALDVSRRTDPYASPDQHYTQVRKLAETKDFDGVIKALETANLRGMGGAGFVAYRKWTEIRKAKLKAVVGTSSTGGLVNADADKVVRKYVVCNADESEVGTFKDRELMLSKAHLLVEAMAIAALTVGATYGYIYIRHEYHDQAEVLRQEIERARSLGVLGNDVCGSGQGFDMEVFVSPGGYVMGEQTALLEAIEGKRGQPRNRRTDIGPEGSASISGLFNGPTLINNVETFCYIPLILAKGGPHFAKLGVNGKQGLKWVGISGDVERPGVFEVPMGITYRELLAMCGGVRGGRKLKAFAPSGPSYGLHPPSHLDTPTDFRRFDGEEPGVGSGAIVFFDDTRCVMDVALNLTQFFRNESCGKCVPCRVGSTKMADIIRDTSEGKPLPTDEKLADLIDRLATTLNITSICGLGQVVHMPILSVARYWPQEIDDHLAGKCSAKVCGISDRRR